MGQKMEKFGKNVVFPEKYFFMKSSEFRVQSSHKVRFKIADCVIAQHVTTNLGQRPKNNRLLDCSELAQTLFSVFQIFKSIV